MIRAYRADDLEAVLDVWHAASLVAHPFLTEEFLAWERGQIRDEWLPMAETLVYADGEEDDGEIVGFIAMIGNEVGAIFVHPEQQRTGVGRALMDEVRGSRPYLELSVFEANPIGPRFYESYGFRVVDSHVHKESGHAQLRMRLD